MFAYIIYVKKYANFVVILLSYFFNCYTISLDKKGALYAIHRKKFWT